MAGDASASVFEIPISGTFGGDSGPAVSGVSGDVSIVQGGMNIPEYPRSLISAPIDRDFFEALPVISGQPSDNIYYYAAAGLVLLLILKNHK